MEQFSTDDDHHAARHSTHSGALPGELRAEIVRRFAYFRLISKMRF
jgi:hypothetical protein